MTTTSNQSTKPVAAGATSVKDPDDDAAKKAEAAAKQAQLDEIKKRAEAAAKAKADAEFEKALAEKDGEISAEQQKKIDAAMGNDPEKGTDAEAVIDDVKSDESLIGRLDMFCGAYGTPRAVITKLVTDVAADTPDEHVLWGIPGTILRMGHLRALVAGRG